MPNSDPLHRPNALPDPSAATRTRAEASGPVFVSYTHDSDFHRNRVAGFVDALRSEGLSVEFDRDLAPAGPDVGWATWSEGAVRRAEKILVVVTEAYEKCWYGEHRPGHRNGATYEAQCIVPRIAQAGADVSFLRPVVFDDADVRFIPHRIASLRHFHGLRDLGDLLAWLRGGPPPTAALAASPTTASIPSAQPRSVGGTSFRYDVLNPARGASFVGRRRELEEFDGFLAGGGGASLVGDARIGKSSLLYAWIDRAHAAGRAAYLFNAQATECGYPQFLCAATGGALSPLPKTPWTADEAADAYEEWVTRQPSPPCLFIDEAAALIRSLDYRFFERLRNLLPRILCVISTTKPLPDLFEATGHTSPFANVIVSLRLGLLEDDDATSLASHAQGHSGLLRDWAGAHPYYLQLLGQAVAKIGRHFTVDNALAAFRSTAEDRFREAWNHFGEKSRAALEDVARGRPGHYEPLKRRGWLTSDGQPFCRAFGQWLRERE